jgi:putative flippase GtrA
MPADDPTTPAPWVRLTSSAPFRYLVAGVASFGFDIGLLWVLHEVARIPLAIATPTAFLSSFVVTYTLQRTFAFRATNSVAPSVLRYAILVAANTALTTMMVWGADAVGLSWVLGKVSAVIVTTVGNYFAYRHWVFRAAGGGPDV